MLRTIHQPSPEQLSSPNTEVDEGILAVSAIDYHLELYEGLRDPAFAWDEDEAGEITYL